MSRLQSGCIAMRTESLLLVVVLLVGCADRAVEPVAPSTLSAVEATRSLTKLAANYGLEVVAREPPFPIATRHGEINGRPCNDAEVCGYADLLAEEFSRYPRDLVRRSCLNRIVLCTNLTYGTQHRGAVPD